MIKFNTMTRKYKISAIVYSSILIFAILFFLLLLGASGHRINFKLEHYILLFYPFINVILLYFFPQISLKKIILKKSLSLLIISFLLVSLFFALKNIFEIFSERLIFGFVFCALIVTGIFITSIIYLLFEILKNLKMQLSDLAS